jgi:hypothetical protein
MTKADWTIKEASGDWECDWEGDERFHHRHFRSLSMTEKIKAVEEMCKTADALKAAGRKAKRKRT